MTDNIKRLELLVKELPALVKPTPPNHIEYVTDSGTCIGFGLYNSGVVGVQRAIMTQGTVFKWHRHDVMEVLIVYAGKMKVLCDGLPDRIMDKGEVVYFAVGQEHSVEALADTWLIAVSVPAAGGYPSA